MLLRFCVRFFLIIPNFNLRIKMPALYPIQTKPGTHVTTGSDMQFSTSRGFPILLILIQILSNTARSQAIPEWQDPQVISINTEKPRADFFPYPTEKAALAMDKKGPFVQSLNGTWKFKWAQHPSQAQLNFYDPKISDAGWDNIPVPSN